MAWEQKTNLRKKAEFHFPSYKSRRTVNKTSAPGRVEKVFVFWLVCRYVGGLKVFNNECRVARQPFPLALPSQGGVSYTNIDTSR